MNQNFDNSPESFLQNIADDLSPISGTCAEINETQLNCATTDDLDNMVTSITSAVIEKVDTMQSSIETQTTTVKEIGDNMTTSIDNLKTEIAEKIDNFTANVHLGVHLSLLRRHFHLAGSPHRTGSDL